MVHDLSEHTQDEKVEEQKHCPKKRKGNRILLILHDKILLNPHPTRIIIIGNDLFFYYYY